MPSGITTHSSPTTLQPIPCYNKHWFVSTSSNVAATDFKFRIVLTDLISGYTETHDVLPNPANKLEFNAQFFAEKNMTNFLAKNLYGWQKCAGASRKIRVNIGEYYTPGGYTAGADIDYITWNAAIDKQDFAIYNQSDYCFDSSIPNEVYLTNLIQQRVFDDRSQFLYFIAQEGDTGAIPSITIYTVSASNIALGVYKIDRPDYTTGLYTDNYNCIDVGPKGLANISPGDVTVISGSLPIITSNVASYLIVDNTNNTPIKRFTVECEPRFEVYTLHYLNRKGCYETLHCSKLTELTSEKNIYTAKKNVWTNVSNVMTYDPSDPEERVQSVSVLDKIRVNSDWLTQAEVTLHKDLFSSPSVYLDLGSSTNYIPVKVDTKNYQTLTSDRRRQLVFDLSYTNDNNRQRG